MDKKILVIWFFVLVLAFGIIAAGVSPAVTTVYTETQETKVRKLDDLKITKSTSPNQDGNYTVSYEVKVPLIHNGGETLMFYTYHSNVTAYVGEKRLYKMAVNKNSAVFPVVLKNFWNQFVITKEYEGKNLSIILETSDLSYLNYVPEFLLGSEFDIILKEVKQSAVSILLTLIILICGIYMTVYSMITGKHRSGSYNMQYLGIFAVLIAMWFFVNIPIVYFVTDNQIFLSYVSYLLIGAVSTPFILFEKQIMDKRFGPFLSGMCVVTILLQLLCVGLQVFGIYNMKQSLLIIHVALLVIILSLILVAAMNIRMIGMKNINKISFINMVSVIIVACAVGADLAGYYSAPNGGWEYILTKMAILIYILLLAYYMIKETEELMKKAKEAERFETLAYADELTGTYNRTAYNEYVRKVDLESRLYTVFMFDLNNLKKCNDTLGHHYGDEYIKSCGQYIREAFELLGACYRIGGDEFCVIAENADDLQIETAYAALREKIELYNREHHVLNISVACGHAKFDKGLDKDLEDTRKRADLLMYENKINMKKNIK